MRSLRGSLSLRPLRVTARYWCLRRLRSPLYVCEYLPRKCKEKIIAIVEDLPAGITAEAEVAGANVGSISVRRLIVATNAARYYDSINRTMNTKNMHYTNVLSDFKVEEEAYTDLKKKPEP